MPLTAAQQRILDQSKANGGQGTIQEMLDIAGLKHSPDNFALVRSILDAEGIVAPTTIAETLAATARAAGPGNTPLTPYLQREFDSAQAMGLSSQGVSDIYNMNGYPLKASEVDDIFAGAGLKLTGKRTGQTPGAGYLAGTPPAYPGGSPGYGMTTINNINTPGDMAPQNPQLRGLFSTMRRKSLPNYRGQTDTILTSGRGVTGNALLRRRVLTGS